MANVFKKLSQPSKLISSLASGFPAYKSLILTSGFISAFANWFLINAEIIFASIFEQSISSKFFIPLKKSASSVLKNTKTVEDSAESIESDSYNSEGTPE